MTSTTQASENDLLDMMIQAEKQMVAAGDYVEIALATLHFRNALAVYHLYGSLAVKKRSVEEVVSS